ncbi:pancreatic triacylglycerol lipase-like isoform X2 [Anticarsia gemmatalis]|uniref:pancreatic triacylglycerol lipase-like isoform X1 n=1 Tax=Anticarsia gemmatalis TaxID=129554 RepID=UPI003F75D608
MFAVKCALVLSVAVAVSTFELGSNDVIFHLFTQNNVVESEALVPSVNAILSSSFSVSKRTVITIHSNAESVAGNFNAFVVRAHLDVEDVNVLAVDWSRGSGMYTQGLANAPQCGEVIAQFINLLIAEFGYNANMVRIVGIGIGAHVAGIAARRINGQVPHVIAIDPSLHGWTHHPQILSSDAANIVEVLHATAGIRGYDYPLGDIDFYPNGGSAQNGCGANVDCSYTYAYAFYAESIRQTQDGGNRFVGTKCDSYENAIAMECTGARDAVFGGLSDKSGASGIYVFSTNTVPPFARD